MKINTKQEQGKKGLNNLLKLTKSKESKKEAIKRLYKEGKIKRINEDCFTMSSECFVLGITPSLIYEVLRE